MIDIERDTELESLVDSHGLAAILTALADICHAKAEHLRANWGDDPAARIWERGAKAMESAERKADGLGLNLARPA